MLMVVNLELSKTTELAFLDFGWSSRMVKKSLPHAPIF